MTTIYINGKFAAQPITGVQRFARELLVAADRLRAALPAAPCWVLLCPPEAQVPKFESMEIRRLGPRGLPLTLWEQVMLPWAARTGILLNLAGSAPLRARRQVCTFHDAAVFDWPQAYTRSFVAWYRFLFRQQARRALQLFTVSQFSRQRLSLHLAIPESRLAVVPDGGDHLDAVRPDAGVLDRLGLRGQPFLLAVASANPAKNLDRLHSAFAQMPQATQARLVLVGGRNAAVFAGAGAQAADPRVLQAGPLDDAALAALYRQARGLIFPSLYEGFGLPPLEAMSLGCPVAAARAAAIPEVCGDAVLYFDPQSVTGMAAAMARLLDDAALRQRLSDAGKQRAQAWRWADAAGALLRQIDPRSGAAA